MSVFEDLRKLSVFSKGFDIEKYSFQFAASNLFTVECTVQLRNNHCTLCITLKESNLKGENYFKWGKMGQNSFVKRFCVLRQLLTKFCLTKHLNLRICGTFFFQSWTKDCRHIHEIKYNIFFCGTQYYSEPSLSIKKKKKTKQKTKKPQQNKQTTNKETNKKNKTMQKKIKLKMHIGPLPPKRQPQLSFQQRIF